MTPSEITKRVSGLAIITGIIVMVITGGCVTDITNPVNISAVPVPGSTQYPGSSGDQTGSGSRCDPQDAAPRVPVPVDTSIPVRDPMPGIRYSIHENESGRTVVLEKGDIVEINLRWAPSVSWTWDVPVSGCGLELVNDGYYDTGTDYWNTSGHYRARYRAVGPGTAFIYGEFGVPPYGTATDATPRFNLTVIVK
ncbi:MAG: protease inhibitor I42 family protein [Methanoregula sp.]|jgi:predicted secreted protein|nr:protease inhibitor I42 family protein [Methanoregula sp.]